MYIETSYPRKVNDTARIISPAYQRETIGAHCVQFWYHMYGFHVGTLNVYSAKFGNTDNRGHRAWQRQFDQGNQWRDGQVCLLTAGVNICGIRPLLD